MAKRPLVETTIRTEFGDVLAEPSFYEVGGADRDMTYVPGFSDMKRARDITLADVASGRIPKHEAKISPLPVNVRWTRTITPKGSPDGRKQLSSANLGYRAANKKDVGQPWLTQLPPGATINADGSIQKGDCALMVVDGATAARNAARKAAQTARLSEDVSAARGGLLDVGGRARGADPYVTKEA